MMAYIAPYLNSFDRDPLLIILNITLEDTICIQNIHYDEFNFQDITKNYKYNSILKIYIKYKYVMLLLSRRPWKHIMNRCNALNMVFCSYLVSCQFQIIFYRILVVNFSDFTSYLTFMNPPICHYSYIYGNYMTAHYRLYFENTYYPFEYLISAN